MINTSTIVPEFKGIFIKKINDALDKISYDNESLESRIFVKEKLTDLIRNVDKMI